MFVMLNPTQCVLLKIILTANWCIFIRWNFHAVKVTRIFPVHIGNGAIKATAGLCMDIQDHSPFGLLQKN